MKPTNHWYQNQVNDIFKKIRTQVLFYGKTCFLIKNILKSYLLLEPSVEFNRISENNCSAQLAFSSTNLINFCFKQVASCKGRHWENERSQVLFTLMLITDVFKKENAISRTIKNYT